MTFTRTHIVFYIDAQDGQDTCDTVAAFRFKVSLHVTLSILAYLATALAHLRADEYAHMGASRLLERAHTQKTAVPPDSKESKLPFNQEAKFRRPKIPSLNNPVHPESSEPELPHLPP